MPLRVIVSIDRALIRQLNVVSYLFQKSFQIGTIKTPLPSIHDFEAICVIAPPKQAQNHLPHSYANPVTRASGCASNTSWIAELYPPRGVLCRYAVFSHLGCLIYSIQSKSGMERKVPASGGWLVGVRRDDR